MPDESVLNPGISFRTFDEDLQKTVSPRMAPMAVHFEEGDEVYKWTQFPLITVDEKTQKERITPFWNCWEELKLGNVVVPGFMELRTRYQNVDGSTGRPLRSLHGDEAL